VVLSTTSVNNIDTQEKSEKRKRSQWTVKEKLDAIALFNTNESKREIAKKNNCTIAQLQNSIKTKRIYSTIIKRKKVLFYLFSVARENTFFLIS
jgi:hypothetical protein